MQNAARCNTARHEVIVKYSDILTRDFRHVKGDWDVGFVQKVLKSGSLFGVNTSVPLEELGSTWPLCSLEKEGSQVVAREVWSVFPEQDFPCTSSGFLDKVDDLGDMDYAPAILAETEGEWGGWCWLTEGKRT